MNRREITTMNGFNRDSTPSHLGLLLPIFLTSNLSFLGFSVSSPRKRSGLEGEIKHEIKLCTINKYNTVTNLFYIRFRRGCT